MIGNSLLHGGRRSQREMNTMVGHLSGRDEKRNTVGDVGSMPKYFLLPLLRLLKFLIRKKEKKRNRE